MSVDLLKNRNPLARLGSFDGRVGAIIEFNAETYFITTNADYIPALPSIAKPHKVYLRSDMRYGMDDPTLWPQPYSRTYSHLAAIPRREQRQDLELMWWQPTHADFVPGSSITRGLGKLAPSKLSQLDVAVNDIVARYRQYKSTASTTPPEFFDQLIQNLVVCMERLQLLPSTYDKTFFGLTSLQRTYLELDALLAFMTVYQPRILEFNYKDEPAYGVAPCMGAITYEPEVAQLLKKAGLPFWFMRPTYAFFTENILKIVTPVEPPFPLTTECPPEQPVVYSGNNTDEKIQAMSTASHMMGWYRDPFTDNAAAGSSTNVGSPMHIPAQSASASVTRTPAPRKIAPRRADPYCRDPGGKKGKISSGPPKIERDKFKPLLAAEMPSYLPSWINALGQVDKLAQTTSISPSDGHYLLPEPALLASPESSQRRQKFMHHWRLLRDAFIYRLSQPGTSPLCLSSQEWRDVLEGVAERTGAHNKRTRNKRSLENVIGSALRACGVDRLHGFPPP
ncbi:hypothetical protein B0H11DRAFT_2104329, partial [Mycena galericulata]